MRYHYQKPDIYRSMYGETYICNHPVYNKCTLFRIGDNGLAVIQQRFNAETKSICIRALGNILIPDAERARTVYILQ